MTFLEVARAAAIPAILYYLSIWLFVHFYSRRIGTVTLTQQDTGKRPLSLFEAAVFFGALGALIGLLLLSFSPFAAVTGALVVILLFSTVRKELNVGKAPRIGALGIFGLIAAGNLLRLQSQGELDVQSFSQTFEDILKSCIMGTVGLLVFGLCHPAWRPSFGTAMAKAARNGVSLVAASACVGIIIGIVQETGIATDFSTVIKGVVQTNLALALVGIMGCSIILGMGVPSVVCYLLMATLMGSLLGELGVIPLAAHLFIFYFGCISNVTPPVSLAAYAAAGIADSPAMKTAFTAVILASVGFIVPFMFAFSEGSSPLLMQGSPLEITQALITGIAGVTALAAAGIGFTRRPVVAWERILLALAAGTLMLPGWETDIAGATILSLILLRK